MMFADEVMIATTGVLQRVGYELNLVYNQRKEQHQNEILFENVFIYKHISRHWLQ